MAWIEAHQRLERSHKLHDLMVSMDWEKFEAMGRLFVFWWWCVDHAEDGDLRKFNDGHLALAAELSPKEGKAFVDAMVQAGFLDRDPYFRIHDWWDYLGTFLQKRYNKKPEKWRHIKGLYRDGPEHPPPEDKGECSRRSSSSPSRSPQPNLTKPNLTKPEGERVRARPSEQGVESSVTNAALPPPKLSSVLAECDRRRVPHWVGEDFFNLWESRLWRDSGVPVGNWKSKLSTKISYWESDGRPMKRPGKANDDDNRREAGNREVTLADFY